MDWNNIDFNDGYEIRQNLLDGYSFEQMFDEIYCNIPNHALNEATVRQQIKESIESKLNCVKEVLETNIENVVLYTK